jgi:hypothetical protein
MNCFVQRQKKWGEKQLSRTFLHVYMKGKKNEREKEREREMRERDERE